MPILGSFIQILQEASPYILFGLFLSGMVHAFIRKEDIVRHLGSPSRKSIFVAALGGIPLPLCSCGVIPMAIALRQQGASPGAIVTFLIATPETGLDSILLSLALLNPLMAICRPVAALVTALTAGLIENGMGRRDAAATAQRLKGQPTAGQEALHPLTGALPQMTTDARIGEAKPASQEAMPTMLQRILKGQGYAFGQLLTDLTPWFLVGLLSSSLISVLVPASVIERFLGGGLVSMLIVVLIGLPMYICASASTPIAATLMLKGMSPGTALVFLLAGPATNATTMLMVWRFLGRRALVIYLLSIAVCAVGLGLALDAFVLQMGLDMKATLGIAGHHHGNQLLENFSAMALIFLMMRSLVQKHGFL